MRGWDRWAATLVLGFGGIARLSEVLGALRCDLFLPDELFDERTSVAFFKIRQPKTRRRGGGVQHLKLADAAAVQLLLRVFGPLDSSLALFPFSASATSRSAPDTCFYSRWGSHQGLPCW